MMKQLKPQTALPQKRNIIHMKFSHKIYLKVEAAILAAQQIC